MKQSAVILCALSVATATLAQPGVPLWTNYYAGSAHYWDQANALAVDAQGNVVVTGYSEPANKEDDIFTIKYSHTGEALWTNYFNGLTNRHDQGTAIALDSLGNVFVTGITTTTHFGGWDFVTLAYSPSGATLWTNIFDQQNADEPVSAIGGSSGNVFVTGTTARTMPLMPAGGPGRENVTIGYSSAGNPLWTNRFAGRSGFWDYRTKALATDNEGNVFVIGDSGGSGFTTVKLSPTGTLIWTNAYAIPGHVGARIVGIALNHEGNVFIAGYGTNLTHGVDYTTIAYSNSGIPLWTNLYNGTGDSSDYASAMGVTKDGSVAVTGRSRSLDGDYDYATVAYSSSGIPLWTNRYGAEGIDAAVAIAADAGGNIFVTGYSTNSATTNQSDYDWVTIGYTPSGTPLWTNRYCGPGNSNDQPKAMTVDQKGNVIVAGHAVQLGGQDSVTIKYASSLPLLDYSRVENDLILSWSSAAFTLQSAPGINGVFTNVPGAISPYTNSLSHPLQFFRLISN